MSKKEFVAKEDDETLQIKTSGFDKTLRVYTGWAGRVGMPKHLGKFMKF